MEANQSSQPRPQPKAAGLNNILNHDESGPTAPPHLRDSGFYSVNDVSSKHTSAASFNSPAQNPSPGYQPVADKTPSPIPGHMAPHNVVSPPASHMSVAAMVSPTTPGGPDQRRLHHQASMESTQSNSTIGESYGNGPASRRESLDSRSMHQGFSSMQLSPYASNNQSTTSIQSQLHSQRNPRPGLEAHSMNRISNGYAPAADRNPDSKTIRTAPAITGPATGNIARAAEPTKGQAWAFPEEQQAQYDASRRSSVSSQFTTSSQLPPGQRRLEDGPSPPGTDWTVPHHVLQHQRLNDLQGLDDDGPTGSQPYSRTPELRVSHKLAERKRRTEMKELFDALRDEMPQERGTKASKWEILTKAINEHRMLKDHANALQKKVNDQEVMIHDLRRQLGAGGGQDNQHYTEPPPPQSSHPSQPSRHPLPPQASQQQSYQPAPYPPSDRTELPPLRTLGAPESMAGVQYDPPGSANGYRHDGASVMGIRSDRF